MSNIVRQNNSSSLYVQSVEKQQDSLALRKKIAHELWLTSIGEFIQWWAVAHKDNRWRIVNEKGEYMRDPSIKNLENKRIDTSPPGYIWSSHKEGNINGNGDFVEKEEDNTDIIQSKNWIFSAKDGIIIVVDNRNFGSARLYTTQWQRIHLPEGWKLDVYGVTDIHQWDDFSALRAYGRNSFDCNSSVFDRRKNIVHGRFAADLTTRASEKLYYSDPDKVKATHNLFNGCAYNLIDAKGSFFATELGDCYANSKKTFDGSCGLLPCIHGGMSNGIVREDEDRTSYKIKRPIFYAVDKDGKIFKDEFGNIIMFDDPYWLNNFDAQWFAPLVIDKKISPIRFGENGHHPYTEYSAYICFINTTGQYRKWTEGEVIIIPFYKTQREYTVTSNDVRGYMLFPELGLIEVRQLSITEPWFRWVNKEIYKCFDYHGKEVQRYKYFNDNGQEKWTDKLERWGTEERIYKLLSEDLTIYWYGTKIDHESPRWWLNSYWWDAKIVNTKIEYKDIKFPDGKDIFNYDFDSDFDKFWKSFIFSGNHVDPRGSRTYECVKINWLVARYTKDEDWVELKLLNHIQVSADEKYIFVQRKMGEPYYILDQYFSYIKDKQSQKLTFPHLPFYVDGVFLSYDDIHWDQNSFYKDLMLTKAYFEDGTLVGEEVHQLDTPVSVALTGRKDIYKALK